MSELNAEPSDPGDVELRERFELLQRQRREDLSRMQSLVTERDRLRHQISVHNASLRPLPDEDRAKRQNPLPAIIRQLDANPSPVKVSLTMKLIAKLLLRFARREARQDNFAAAEILYQALMLFRPRPFLLRQTGTMLARQNHHFAAAACFERAIAQNGSDAEAWLAYSIALRHIGNETKAKVVLAQAIALDPSMAHRAHF